MVHQIAENNTTGSSAHENDGQMILFSVTKCLASFKVAAKNCSRLSKIAGKRYLLQANAIYCRQEMLLIAGKCYLLQANAFLQAHK
jgi:hypothetical protein